MHRAIGASGLEHDLAAQEDRDLRAGGEALLVGLGVEGSECEGVVEVRGAQPSSCPGRNVSPCSLNIRLRRVRTFLAPVKRVATAILPTRPSFVPTATWQITLGIYI